jgi:hypothetical protein
VSKALVNFASRSRIKPEKRSEQPADREVPRLLGDPRPGRVARNTCEVHAPRTDLDEEQDAHAA